MSLPPLKQQSSSHNNSFNNEHSEYTKLISSNIQIHKDQAYPLLYIITHDNSISVLNEKDYTFLYHIPLQHPANINTTCGCYYSNTFCLLTIGNNNTLCLYIPSTQNAASYMHTTLSLTNQEQLTQNDTVIHIQLIKNNYIPYFILYTSSDNILFLSITKSHNSYIGTFLQYQNNVTSRASFFGSIMNFQNPFKSVYNHFNSINNNDNSSSNNVSSCYIVNPFSYTTFDINTTSTSVFVVNANSLKKFVIEFNDVNSSPTLVYSNSKLQELIMNNIGIKINSFNIIACDVKYGNNNNSNILFCVIEVYNNKYFLIRIELKDNNNNSNTSVTYVDISESFDCDSDKLVNVMIHLNKAKNEQEGLIVVVYSEYTNLILFNESQKISNKIDIKYKYGYPVIGFNCFNYNVFSLLSINTFDMNYIKMNKQYSNEYFQPNYKYMKAFQRSMMLMKQKDMALFQLTNSFNNSLYINSGDNSNSSSNSNNYIINNTISNINNNDLLNQLIHIHKLYSTSNEITADINELYNDINNKLNEYNENMFCQSIIHYINIKKEHHVPNVEILNHSSTKAEKIIIEYLNEKEQFFTSLLTLLVKLQFFQNIQNQSRLAVFNALFLALESLTISKQIRIYEDNSTNTNNVVNPTTAMNYNLNNQTKHSFFCNLYNITDTFVASLFTSINSHKHLFTFITDLNNALYKLYSYTNTDMTYYTNIKGSLWCLNTSILNDKLPSLFLMNSNNNISSIPHAVCFDYIESLFHLLEVYYTIHKSSQHNTRYYNLKKELCAVLQRKSEDKCFNDISIKFNEYYSLCSIAMNNKDKYYDTLINVIKGKDNKIQMFMLKILLQLELEKISKLKGRNKLFEKFDYFDDFGMEFQDVIEVVVQPYDYLRKLFVLYVNQKNETSGDIVVDSGDVDDKEDEVALNERNMVLIGLSETVEGLVAENAGIYKECKEDVEMDIKEDI